MSECTSSAHNTTTIACHECDLLVTLPPILPGNKAHCPRCHYLLTAHRHHHSDKIIGFAAAALLFLLPALLLPFMTLDAQGQSHTISLLESVTVLFEQGYASMALLVFLVIVAAPVSFLVGLIYIVSAIKIGKFSTHHHTLLGAVTALTPWSMVEIFIIGLLVSLIKIASMADITVGLSFWAFMLFGLCLTAVLLHVDKVQLWQMTEHYEQ